MNNLDFSQSFCDQNEQNIIYWLFINFGKEYLGIISLLSGESRAKLLSFVKITEDGEFRLLGMNNCDIYTQICVLVNREKARFAIENIFRDNHLGDISSELASNYMKTAQVEKIESLGKYVNVSNDDKWEIDKKNIDLSQYFYMGLDMTPIDVNAL